VRPTFLLLVALAACSGEQEDTCRSDDDCPIGVNPVCRVEPAISPRPMCYERVLAQPDAWLDVDGATTADAGAER